jgi:glucose-6-phosphate isomerase
LDQASKKKHFEEMQNSSIQELFKLDTTRNGKFNIKWNDFLIDYSKTG